MLKCVHITVPVTVYVCFVYIDSVCKGVANCT